MSFDSPAFLLVGSKVIRGIIARKEREPGNEATSIQCLYCDSADINFYYTHTLNFVK